MVICCSAKRISVSVLIHVEAFFFITQVKYCSAKGLSIVICSAKGISVSVLIHVEVFLQGLRNYMDQR